MVSRVGSGGRWDVKTQKEPLWWYLGRSLDPQALKGLGIAVY